MKYALAGLAAAAAIVALFFRPPGIGPATLPAAANRAPDRGFAVLAESSPRRAARPAGGPLTRHIVVYVAGEVRKPGVYALPSDSRGVDALGRAGGALPDADLVAVNLAAPLADGDELAVPKIGEPVVRGRSRSPRARQPHRTRGEGHRSRRSAAEPAQEQTIDINAANEAELQDVPGIGPGLAARIVEYRETNGPFASIDELADVSGITPRLQEALAQFAFVR
jgi:competence protein ComEA